MSDGPSFYSINFTGNGVHRIDQALPGLNVSKTHSNILAAATQVDDLGAPFIGAASIQVLNIAPDEDAVHLYVNILWDSPITIRIAFVIWP